MADEAVGHANSAGGGTGLVRVFMSYRRADDRHFIGRLHDRLCDAFGGDMVFRDIDSIPAGTNFRSVILRTLNEVDVVVAVIGPNWAAQARDSHDTDFVFLELAEALRQGKPVVPTLIEDTSMPATDTLPSDLVPFTAIHAISVHGDPSFRRDSARLIDAIRDVVTRDRARVAQERHVAEELARRAEEERSERERLTEQLRTEEQAARAHLAELEDAAAQRQIELERARIDAIAEKLRLAEVAGGTSPLGLAERPDAVDALLAPTVPAKSRPAAPVEAPTIARTTSPLGAEHLLLQALLAAAMVLGVVGLTLNRSVATPFSELSKDWKVDATVWTLTFAIGVPLLLAHRPVEQRFVLIGVAVSSFFFEFVQASAVLRSGTTTRYDEGSWFLVKLVQTACLIGAIWTVRHGATRSLSSSPRVRVALVAVAIACGAAVIAATYDEWSHTKRLVDNGYLPGRSPFAVWLVVLVLGPLVLAVALAAHPSYGARVTLATISSLAAVNYLSQALVIDQVFGLEGTRWALTSAAHVPLAVMAWWTVAAGRRQANEAP